MAEYAIISSCAKPRLQKSCFKLSHFVPRITCFRIVQRKHFYGNRLFVRFSSWEVCGFSSSIAKILEGSLRFKESSLRSCCFGSLINPESATPSSWVPIVDQVLMMSSIVLAYMAGVVPSQKDYFNSRKNISDHDAEPANYTSSGSAIKSDDHQVNLKYAWDLVKEKLLDALDAIQHDGNSDNRVVECEKYSTNHPLSLYAIREAPKLRLLWATLQRLEKEVNNISGSYMIVDRDDWLAVLPDIIQKFNQPVFVAWLEEELFLENRSHDKEILSTMSKKLKGDDAIFQNIKKSGKADLYADFLFFLRFCSLGVGCRYDSKLLASHGVDILEDLVITLADGITSSYLELISVDSNMSTEMNRLGLNLCSMSTRALQRLRNEVALKQWLHRNMESVVSMYEDRIDLWTFRIQLVEEPNKHQMGKFHWWKKLVLKKPASTLSPLRYVVISQLSMSVKRILELRALNGWRYYFSLFLECSDITMPLVRAIFAKVSNAVSFFLVCLIGRSLGLIYTGIRQSLGWR